MRQGGNRDTSKLLMERSVAVPPGLDVPAQPLVVYCGAETISLRGGLL